MSTQPLIAVLSCVCSQGIWILTNDKADPILAESSWEDAETSELSAGIIPAFERVLAIAGHKASKLSRLYVVSGPGAFTALRVSASFVLGLAQALNIKAFGIPTFDLVGEDFQIPLQHQRQKKISIKDLAQDQSEILKITGPTEASLDRANSEMTHRGFLERPHWPNAEELRRALVKNLNVQSGVSVFYGLEPKISGKRESTS